MRNRFKPAEKFTAQYLNKNRDKIIQFEFRTGEESPELPFTWESVEFTTLYRYKSEYLDGMPYSSTDWIYP